MNNCPTLLIAELLATHGTVAVLRAIEHCAAANAECERTRPYCETVAAEYQTIATQVGLLADGLESRNIKL